MEWGVKRLGEAAWNRVGAGTVWGHGFARKCRKVPPAGLLLLLRHRQSHRAGPRE